MHRFIRAAAASAVIVLALTGCSASASNAKEKIVLLTHDSFALSAGILAKFTATTGIEVETQALGDAGSLVNKLVLTKDSPLGDAVYGIDNTFASRAVTKGVLADYESADLTDAEKAFQLPAGQGAEQLTPIDYGDVCVNVDHDWFAEHGVPEPATFDDLTKPAYKNLLVVEAANSSSPGLAFLLATIAAKGDGWQAYWKQLVANGVQVDASWNDAYYVDFSGPSSTGDRPLVVSYASSPPDEVKKGVAHTGALLDTCFRQTEFAGVVKGTKHAAAAQSLVDFLLSTTVQNDIPGQMYVYPVNEHAEVPADWRTYAPVATKPWNVSAADIDAHRDEWISDWAAIAAP